MFPEVKRILFPSDMDPHSQHAFAYAASIAERYQAKIIILHVLETISLADDSAMALYFGNKKWRQIKEEIADDAVRFFTQHINQFCRDADRKLQACPFDPSDIVIRRGHPAEIIIEEAQQQKVDMVVMGVKAVDADAALDEGFGETARIVLSGCRIPVLVVRSPAENNRERQPSDRLVS